MACASCGADVPADARFCPSCGAALGAAPASEERKVATVLFADLVGSTELGGEQDPERTRALLERFYDAMAAEIAGAGGTVEKFAGDAVMAVFGAPAAQEDHAERALHAALAMRRRLSELFGGRLQMRVGVNSGEVVVGQAREGSSFVTGDAVNVCARLEQNAAPGEILVGERTVALVRGAFELGDLMRIEAKGKRHGVACRRLVRALTLMRPRGVGGLRPAFVGREAELDVLRATFGRVVTSGEPHLVTIMGDAGVGKTRLVRELWRWLGGLTDEPLRRTGRCLPYGHAITYWPLGEILKEHFGILENDPRDVALGRLGGRTILGLALGLDVAGELHPMTARDRLHEAWAEFLAELVRERPAVVLVEDLHWADEPLLVLLERVIREVEGPLLLLATARPELLERRPAWAGGRRNASILGLEPLTSGDAERLLEEALAGTLPGELRELVVARSEGNPFFLEELVGTLIDRGVLEPSDGGWRVRELPAGFAVPDSVQAVLAARIDLLPPLEKAALQAAAVVGRVFWAGAVRDLLDGAEPAFELLEERDFVRRRSSSSMAGEREYAIKHALTREVAYAGLTKAKRARLHAAFAEWLERAGEGRDESAALLAHHYRRRSAPRTSELAWAGEEPRRAELAGKAVAWLRRAAELAVRRYEVDDAIALLERALALASGTTEAELWRDVGRVHALRYDGEAFWTAMQSSLRVSPDPRTRADTYSLLAFHTSARSGMWKRRPDPELVEGWIGRALELADADSPARARALIARANWRPEGDDAAAREANALAERLGDVELRSYALEACATAAFYAGRFQESLMWSQRRLDLLDRINDPDHVVQIHESAVPVRLAVGRFGEARRLAEEADRLSRRLSSHHQVHGLALRLEVEELAGGWGEILALTARVEEAVLANVATPCARNPRSLLLCAAAHAYAGDLARAAELERAADELGMEGYGLAIDSARTWLALARGDLARVAEPAVASAEHFLSFGLAARTARLEALVELGDREAVEREAQPLLQPDTFAEAVALRALGAVRGDEELLRRAAARFQEMGLDWHVRRTRALVRE
ncbi:MAG TPA: adenylate/guanylate cyclase domain-containing protein [Gaiellaceae bacterium]|nr:adenylate/guanylate cyclase domain-containing protein [Gaiellaceae bacterium]